MSVWQREKNEANPFTITVILVGLFVGFGILLFVGQMTFIRIDTIVNYAILFGAVIFLLHLPFRKRLNRYLVEILAYSFIGWALIITSLLIGANYLFHGPSVSDRYTVESSMAHPEDRTIPFPVSITLENNDKQPHANVPPSVYDDYPYFLKFEGEEELINPTNPTVAQITTAKGLFGYRVLLHKELR